MRASIAIAVGAVASVTFFASFDAHACGESLFRVGRGVAYRAQTAPLPGNVLVVAPSAESKELAERLSAAGHSVHVVDTPEQVAQEIRSGKYDVVLASYNDRAVDRNRYRRCRQSARVHPRHDRGLAEGRRGQGVSALSVGRRRLHAVLARHPSHAQGGSEGVTRGRGEAEARAIGARTLFLVRRSRRLRSRAAAAHAQDVTRDPTARRGEMEITYQHSKEQDLVTSNFGIAQDLCVDEPVARFQRPLRLEGALDHRGRIAAHQPQVGRRRKVFPRTGPDTITIR